ncbi:MAG: PKD domain-containing protein [Bacteroidota bacterium]
MKNIVSGNYYFAGIILLLFLLLSFNKSSSQNVFLSKQIFNFTDADQALTVPSCAIQMKIKIWGAGGGGSTYNFETAGAGAGGYVEGFLSVNPGDVFSVMVGEGGACDGTADVVSYGFGGSYSAPAYGGFAGGLSGLFTGTTAITANDQSRALLIAGGGGSSERDAPNTYCTSGGQGGDVTFGGGMPNFQGENGGIKSGGGAGGGYSGGLMTLRLSGNGIYYAGEGGTNFVHSSITSGLSAASTDFGNWNVYPQVYKDPPNVADADYTPWVSSGSPGIGTGNMVTYTKAGHGRVVIEFYSNPALVPAIIISPSATTICPGTLVNFTATPTNGGTTPAYQWQLNGANAGTNSSSYSNSTLANNDIVTCILTSNSPCVSTSTATSNAITISVTTSVAPSLSITALPAGSICSGTNVTFTATPTNGGTTPVYQWQLNGLNTGSNSNVYSNSTLANNDIVTCILTSNSGCANPSTATSNALTISVSPAVVPSISITALPAGSICIGTAVTFTAVPTNGGTAPVYQWQLNGLNAGTNSTSYSNSTLSNNDVITCILTSNGTCTNPTTATSNLITMSVITQATPSVSITVSPNGSICPGASVTFTAVPVNGGTSPAYQWQVDGSNVGTNSATFTTATLTNGQVVSCVMTSNDACANPATGTSPGITTIVNPLPTATITGTAAVCKNATAPTITFTGAGGTAPYTFSYTINGGTNQTVTSVGNNATVTVTTSIPGTYLYSLVSIQDAGSGTCSQAQSGTAAVTVHPLPIPDFSFTGKCLTQIMNFNDSSMISSGTNLNLTWSFGDGSPVINNQSTTHVYAALGAYPVQLLAVSDFGCRDSITKTITVNPSPVVNFSATNKIGCELLCVGFQDSSFIATGSNVAWDWNVGDGSVVNNSQIFDHCYTNDNAYSPNVFNVSLTVTSDNGCAGTLSKNNFITVFPNPIASFTAQPKTTTITNPVISISDLSTGTDLWNWNFGDSTISSLSGPGSHIYQNTGTYTITLITSTVYNCIDTAYETVIIEPEFEFYIPNAFTPNGDEKNDSFSAKGLFIKQYEMMIFDRWGNLIFFSEDINKGWDGKINHGNEIALQDVYVYSIRVVDFKKEEYFYKGIVTLLR